MQLLESGNLKNTNTNDSYEINPLSNNTIDSNEINTIETIDTIEGNEAKRIKKSKGKKKRSKDKHGDKSKKEKSSIHTSDEIISNNTTWMLWML